MKGDELVNIYLFGFLVVPADDPGPTFMLGLVPRHWCIGYEHQKGSRCALALGPLRLFFGSGA